MRFGPLIRLQDPLGAGPATLRDDGAYLTDGRRLFRVVASLGSFDRPDMAVLEDCKTLNLVVFTADELCSMPFTPVTAMDASTG